MTINSFILCTQEIIHPNSCWKCRPGFVIDPEIAPGAFTRKPQIPMHVPPCRKLPKIHVKLVPLVIISGPNDY
jgi:hypothetical protein